MQTYATIAEAERAITDAGYVRDSTRHVWMLPGTAKTAKVMRSPADMKFYIEWR